MRKVINQRPAATRVLNQIQELREQAKKKLNLLHRELGRLSDELAKHERVTASQDAIAKKYSN